MAQPNLVITTVSSGALSIGDTITGIPEPRRKWWQVSFRLKPKQWRITEMCTGTGGVGTYRVELK